MASASKTPCMFGADNPAWKGGVSSTERYRYQKTFRSRFPEKYRAQWKAKRAIKSGRLVRPDRCSQCDVACKPQAHHDDYSKPLDVRWLCRQCHSAYHAELRRQKDRVA